MYELYIVTCGAHKDMVEPEKAHGDRFFFTPEDAEKYLSTTVIEECRKHYRVQTVIMSLGCEGHLVSLKNLEHQFSSFIQSCKSYLPEDDNEKVYKYLENRLFDIREEIKELREDMYS